MSTTPATPASTLTPEQKAQRALFLKTHLKITHDTSHSRFIITPEDLNSLYPDEPDRRTDENARLVYTLTPPTTDDGVTVIDFVSTYCPPQFRGPTGISEYLVKVGLTWATQQQYQIKATCWYVNHFLPFTPDGNDAKL